jgi:hypothetical protein
MTGKGFRMLFRFLPVWRAGVRIHYVVFRATMVAMFWSILGFQKVMDYR